MFFPGGGWNFFAWGGDAPRLKAGPFTTPARSNLWTRPKKVRLAAAVQDPALGRRRGR